MKPTHVGRLKSFNELFKLDRSLWPNVITAGYIKDLAELMGKEIELDKKENHIKENHYGAGDILIHRDWFLDLREIKPEIEIPKGDFWVITKTIRYTAKLSRDGKGGFDVLESPIGWIQDSFSEREVLIKLKQGTWEICDAPEKVIIPWSDEDWKEWFLNDGKVIDNRGADDEDYTNVVYLMIHGLTPDDEDQFYYMGEGEWLSKETFLREFLDRHGNKFEKEA